MEREVRTRGLDVLDALEAEVVPRQAAVQVQEVDGEGGWQRRGDVIAEDLERRRHRVFVERIPRREGVLAPEGE